MAVLSGKDGTLYIGASQVTPVSNWKLSIKSDNQAYAANDTGGWKKRVAAVKDSSGSCEIKVDDAQHCPVYAGDGILLKLHVDQSGNNYYEVPAVVENVEVDADISNGGILAYAVSFSGDGAVVKHGIVAKSGSSSGS